MSTISSRLANADLADPVLWAKGELWDLFEAMQAEDPVHFSPQRSNPDEGGFWSLTRYGDVAAGRAQLGILLAVVIEVVLALAFLLVDRGHAIDGRVEW